VLRGEYDTIQESINRYFRRNMNRLSGTTLVFAVTFAIFALTPAFLNSQFAPYPLTKVGDWFDLLTPLVMLPLYWLLLQGGWQATAAPRFTLLFLLLAAVWAQAQGMHLAANAIGHLLSEGDGDVYTLTHFFDEVLSHYLWHGAVMGLAALPGRSTAASWPGNNGRRSTRPPLLHRHHRRVDCLAGRSLCPRHGPGRFYRGAPMVQGTAGHPLLVRRLPDRPPLFCRVGRLLGRPTRIQRGRYHRVGTPTR
jgi:hypothetical protein